ncbi:MAG: ATP-binding protein [Rectinemataceae bacterium]
MLPDPEFFAGRVNLVGGPGAACGKTTFAKAALASLREAGRGCALISAGLEGGISPLRPQSGGAGRGRVSLRKGEIFVTAAAFLRSATCMPEILEAVPGSSALGKLAVARACRDGEAALVGPERNEWLSWVIRRIIEEGWTDTVIVDGSMNRITQAASLPRARVFWAVRAGRGDYLKIAAKMRHMLRLVNLPEMRETGPDMARIEGPFTGSGAAAIPSGVKGVIVEDFTKIFLDGRELAAFLGTRTLSVAHCVEFGGFSVALHDMGRPEFEKALGEECAGAVVSWDAYAAQGREKIHA